MSVLVTTVTIVSCPFLHDLSASTFVSCLYMSITFSSNMGLVNRYHFFDSPTVTSIHVSLIWNNMDTPSHVYNMSGKLVVAIRWVVVTPGGKADSVPFHQL